MDTRRLQLLLQLPAAAEGVGMVFGDIRDEPNGRTSVPGWLLTAHLPVS